MPNYKAELLSKIASHAATVAVIGLGHVGLPLAVALAEHGFPVIGIDVDAHKIDSLNNGESNMPDISSSRLAALLDRPDVVRARRLGTLRFTTHYDALDLCDAAVIAVPTPLSGISGPEARALSSAGKSVAERIRPGMLVSLAAPAYSGTINELLRPILESGGLRAGRDFFLAYFLERSDPGRQDLRAEKTHGTVAGVTPDCRDVAQALYTRVYPT